VTRTNTFDYAGRPKVMETTDPTKAILSQLHYQFDLHSNITRITEEAPGTPNPPGFM
jgi:hypothetical protein